MASITDGSSNTFLIGEKHVVQGKFGEESTGDSSIYSSSMTEPLSRVAGPAHLLARTIKEPFNFQFGSYHPGVCQFVFCDGSVHSVPVTTPGTILQLLTLRNDGLVIPAY